MWLVCGRSDCSYYTTNRDRLARHKAFHGNRSDRMLICPEPQCAKHFFSLQKCLSHDRKCHTGLTEWQCQVCLKHVTDIKVHLKIHSEEKKFGCEKCPMRFRHKNSLARHLWQHEAEKPEKCSQCGKEFVSKTRLVSHERKHRRPEEDYFVIIDVFEIKPV